jgi:uncharacterized membrane protein
MFNNHICSKYCHEKIELLWNSFKWFFLIWNFFASGTLSSLYDYDTHVTKIIRHFKKKKSGKNASSWETASFLPIFYLLLKQNYYFTYFFLEKEFFFT